MSLFRRRLGAQSCDPSDKKPSPSVFKTREIVERPESAPALFRPPKSCSSGFPNIKHTGNLGIAKIGKDSTVDESIGPGRKKSSDLRDYESENIRRVLSMSPQEVNEALSEAGLYFSVESLRFLQRRGENDSVPNSAAAGNHSAKGDESFHPNFLGSPESWMDPDFESDPSCICRPGVVVGELDRYDLEGRKIITRSDFLKHFESILNQDLFIRGLIISPDIELILSGAISYAGDGIFSSALRHGLCRCDADTKQESQSAETLADRELFHHEFEHKRAGYSLHEACEVQIVHLDFVCHA